MANGGERFYVTPPINSYYSRLVHELAEEHGLAHESIKGVGMLYKDDTKTFKHCFTGEFVSSHSAFEIEAKAVLITKPGLDAKVKELLLTEAREVAAAREPSQGGAIGRRIRKLDRVKANTCAMKIHSQEKNFSAWIYLLRKYGSVRRWTIYARWKQIGETKQMDIQKFPGYVGVRKKISSDEDGAKVDGDVALARPTRAPRTVARHPFTICPAGATSSPTSMSRSSTNRRAR